MTGSTLDGGAPGAAADVRARVVEEQMTDGERFSLLVSVRGKPRIPSGP